MKTGPAAGGASSTQNFRGRSLKGFLREMEKQFIMETIQDHHGDKEAAASSLKVSLATLYRKLPDAE
ncbi:MAG: helix-turn-helix domain-containing protein, partial [Kiritimatiellia bacterium]